MATTSAAILSGSGNEALAAVVSEAAKAAARTLLDAPTGGAEQPPVLTEGPIEVHPSAGWLPEGTDSVAAAIRALVAAAPEFGYIAVQAYLDRGEDKEAVFEFFVRRLPARRGFLLAAGTWATVAAGAPMPKPPSRPTRPPVLGSATGRPRRDRSIPSVRSTCWYSERW